MTRPFEDALREELMAAARRPPRRRLVPPLAAVAVVAFAAIVAATTLLSPDQAAADVEVTTADGRVTVRLNDTQNSPEDIEIATGDADLVVRVEGVPAGPSQIGRFVGEFATDADVTEVERLDVDGSTYMAFSVPEGWPGELTVYLGQRAAESEPYRVASDAYAVGEPLACSGTFGGPLAGVVDVLEGFEVSVQVFDEQQQPSAPLTLDDAMEAGYGDELVTGAVATSSTSLLVHVGRHTPMPAEVPEC